MASDDPLDEADSSAPPPRRSSPVLPGRSADATPAPTFRRISASDHSALGATLNELFPDDRSVVQFRRALRKAKIESPPVDAAKADDARWLLFLAELRFKGLSNAMLAVAWSLRPSSDAFGPWLESG